MKKYLILGFVVVLIGVSGALVWQAKSSRLTLKGISGEAISAEDLNKWDKSSDNMQTEVQGNQLYIQESIGSEGVALVYPQKISGDFIFKFKLMSLTQTGKIKIISRNDDGDYEYIVELQQLRSKQTAKIWRDGALVGQADAFTLKPDWVSVREIIKVGFPSTLVQILTSVVNMAMNAIIITFSSTAVAAFGVCTKIQNITTVGVHGITNGLIPIVAYNYGAKQKERIRQSIRYGILYGGGLFLIFFAVLEFCPGVVLKLFDASDNLMRIGVPALRILSVAYRLSIPGLIYQAALQGLSLGKESMYISMTRQAILPLMFAFLLKGFGNLNLIWGAFVLAELCGIPLAAALWKRKGEKQIQF